jgi:hypothetical protein
VAFFCLAETSPTASVLFRTGVQKHGITIHPNELFGTPEQCFQMLKMIGFENISFKIEQFGFYLQDIEAGWAGNAERVFGLQNVEWSSDVNDYLSEYATFKAIGYRDRYLLLIVLEQSLILASLGFIPGLALALGQYTLIRNLGALPISMTFARLALVFSLTVVNENLICIPQT